MITALNYIGGDNDRGGIVSVVRALASAGRYECLLGVNPGFAQRREPPLKTAAFPAIPAESIDMRTLVRSRTVAKSVRSWLHEDPSRVYHGRSRAGLMVALWLRLMGEKRAVATVHCLGRQRWFYRAAAAILGPRLYWLGPSMKRYYGLADGTWSGCLPDCVPEEAFASPPAIWGGRRPARFGCAGTLLPWKQWELVLQALARIPSDKAVRVRHAGGEDGTAASAEYAGRLRRLAKELGVEGRVDWLGEIADMRPFYAEVDCLISSSSREPNSIAVLEAAAGIPVLASDASSTGDLVVRAGLGRVFAADSPDALASQMTEFASDGGWGPTRRDEGAMAAFTAPVAAQAHLEVYRLLISA